MGDSSVDSFQDSFDSELHLMELMRRFGEQLEAGVDPLMDSICQS